MAVTAGVPARDDSAALVDCICDELDGFFDRWRKSGQTVTDSPLVIVARATIATEKMKLTPEVEKRVVTEAALRTFKKLAGEDAAVDVDLVADQIPVFYTMVKPTCAVVIEESQFGINNMSQPPDPPPAPVNNAGEVPGLPMLSRLIEFTDAVAVKFMKTNSVNGRAKSFGSKPKSFKPRAKNFANVASLIAFACSFAAKEMRKCGGNPKLVSILNKITTIATAAVMIVPMAMALPPMMAWIVGVAAVLVVVVAVVLTPDCAPQGTTA